MSTPATWQVQAWIAAAHGASTARRSNLPYGFQYESDHLMLDQAWLRLDRPTEKESPRHAGLHLDAYVGTDHVFTRARGLFSHQTGEVGFDPLQFYAGWHVSGIAKGTDVRIGRFSSPIGAEYNDSPSNMLVSHSYSFIYDPFTHTGVYASTTLDSDWTLLDGVVTGSDVFIDPAARATFINGARYIDSKNTRRSAQLVTILGPGRYDVAHALNNPQVVDLVLTYPLASRLLLTLDTVYGWENGVPDAGRVDWLGIVPYLTWTFSDTLASTFRLELFDDDEGNRTGFAGEYRTATVGVTWKPERWMMVRPELRYDHHSGAGPFEGRSHLATATLELILKW